MAVINYVIFIYFLGVSTGQESVVNQLFCGSWTTWVTMPMSACGATCGTGTTTQNRTRQCTGFTVPSPPAGCSFSQREVTSRSCNTGVPCTGLVGTWGAWTNEGLCSMYCGNQFSQGTQTQRRTRTCTPAGQCSQSLVQRREVECIRTTFQQVTCNRFAAAPCEGRGFQTFLYDYIIPFFNLCVNGRYQQEIQIQKTSCEDKIRQLSQYG